MLTVVASMEHELAGLRRELRRSGRASGPVAVELRAIGVGRSEVERALLPLLRRLGRPGGRPGPREGLLLLGLAGAVDPDIGTGTLVLPPRYHVMGPVESAPCRPSAQNSPLSPFENGGLEGFPPQDAPLLPPSQVGGRSGHLSPDPEMWKRGVAAAGAMNEGWAELDSLTVDHVVTMPQAKQSIRERHPVGIVDMEDYWVAAACREAGVPFLAARVVLDPASQALPGYLPDLAGSSARAAITAAAMPWRIPTLLGLARRLAPARGVLTRFALAFLSRPAGGEPAGAGVPAGAAGSAPR